MTDTPGEADRRGPGSDFVPRGAIVGLAIALPLLAALVLYSLWAFWPEGVPQGGAAATGNQPPSQEVDYFGWKREMSRETLFFVIVALAGVLGGLIHTIRSMSWYVGHRDFRWSWMPFNLLLPIIGALGGTVFYLVLRAGLFSPSTSVDQASPFGFAAVAVLVGLFSEQAFEKLRDVASNLFSERPKGKDHVEPKPAASDAPRGTSTTSTSTERTGSAGSETTTG